MTYAEIIERRIANRTAMRSEWHAYRRWSAARRRGIPTPDIALFPAVLMSDLTRGARAFLRSPEGRAMQAVTRRLS